MTSASTALDLVVVFGVNGMRSQIGTMKDFHEGHLISQIDVLVGKVVTPTDKDE